MTSKDVGEWVLVPRAALDWLNGSGPDPSGCWFGDFPEGVERPKGAFWWRVAFRDMCEHYRAAAPLPQGGVEPVAWMHPTTRWVNVEYGEVETYCRREGPYPIPLYAASALSTLLAERDALRAKCGKQNDYANMRDWQVAQLAPFAKWVIEESAFFGCDLSGGDVQEKAAAAGLITATTYDPAKHGPTDMAEPGDEWFVFTSTLDEAGPTMDVAALAARAEAAETALTTLQQQLMDAREALRPFAEAAAHYDPDEGDDGQVAWAAKPLIGELRRARKALSTIGEQSHE